MNIKINSLKSRRGLFLAFAFAMTATLSFLAIYNMTKTNAASFNAGDIMSDAVMANYNSMSEADINNFMHSKNSCNDTNLSKRNRYPNLTYQIRDGHFVCLADQTFNGQSAAHIIWQAAQDYKINPQVLLVLLQKEQSLITDTWPDDQQIRKATGFACTDSAPCDQSKSGFENQIRKAANLYRTVLDGGWSNYPVGNNYVQYNPNTGCGGSTIYIANRATSSLYRYTPYQPNAAALNGGGDSCSAYGNLNFWKYFTNWFGDTHAIANIKSVYIAEGIYTLNTTAGKVLGFNGVDNGIGAQVMENNGSDYTKFILEKDDYQYYRIKHVASGRYIDVSNASADNGAKIQIWNGNSTCAQKWTVEIIGEKTYRLRNACSFKSIDVNNGAVGTVGSKVQIWTDNTTNAQQWILTNTSDNPVENGIYNIETSGNKAFALSLEQINNGVKLVTGELHSAITERFQITRNIDGFYRIKNMASDRYLDVANASDLDGTSIQLWDKNNTCAQRWAIKPVNGGYKISTACSGKSIDISNGKTSDENIKIQIWTHNTTNAQVFNFRNPTGRTIDDGVYTIESNTNANKYLDVSSVGDAKDGDNLQLWSPTGKDNQKFQITYNETTGFYTINNLYTGRSLDVSNASRSNGGNIQNWTYNDTCAQRWMIKDLSNNIYRIMSACSRLSMDVDNASTKNGTNIQVWTGNTTPAQQWEFHKVDTPSIVDTSLSEDKVYTIESSLSPDILLGSTGNFGYNGANVVINRKNGLASPVKWKIKQIGSFYQMINTNDYRALDLANAGSYDGVNLWVWYTNNTCAQKWRLSAYDDKYYIITSACNNKVIDVANANTINGANVWLWTRNNTAAQRWKFVAQN